MLKQWQRMNGGVKAVMRLVVGLILAILLISNGVVHVQAETSDSKTRRLGPNPADVVMLHPSAIRGVKWKSDNVEHKGGDLAATLDFEFGGIAPEKVIKALEKAGVTAVIIRLHGPNRLHNYKQLTDEQKAEQNAFGQERVVNLVKLVKENSDLPVYIWQRQWLDRYGRYKTESQLQGFYDHWVRIIEMAQREGVDDRIHGLALIETHCASAKSVCDTALLFAQNINKRTDGWLKNRSVFLPGAGFGMFFNDIQDNGETFFQEMEKEVGTFAFIYKSFFNTAGDPLQDKGELFKQLRYKGPESEYKKLLDETYGVDDLYEYVEQYKGKYPHLANVIYFGDEGDGVANTQRFGGGYRVIHEILVRKYGWTGYFFNLAIANRDADEHRQDKSLLTADSRTGEAYPNPDAYHLWSKYPDPNYSFTDDDLLALTGEIPIERLTGTVVDNVDAKFTGKQWKKGNYSGPNIGAGYHSFSSKNGDIGTATYEAKLPKSGRYEVRAYYRRAPVYAKNVRVEIEHAGGTAIQSVDQTVKPDKEGLTFVSLGVFKFGNKGVVRYSSDGVDGPFMVDAIQWIPAD